MSDKIFRVNIDLDDNQLLTVCLEKWDSLSLPSDPSEARFGYHQIYRIPVFYDGFEWQRLATEEYVNSNLEGLAWKDDVRAATTENIDIATALNDGDTIDDVTLADDDRVLVKNQTDADENGIYIVADTPVRATDMDASSEFNNAIVSVDEGTENTGTTWRCSTLDPVVDVDDITFVDFTPTVPDASEVVKGKTAYATVAQVAAGDSHSVAVTPYGLDSRLSPLEEKVDILIPSQPQDLSGLELTMTFYSALESGTGTLIENLTDDTTPDGVVEDFYDGDGGTLSAEVDSVADGSVVLSTSDDTGTYTSLVVDADEDPYEGEFGEGLYKQLTATVRSSSALSVGEHTYQLKHTETGDSALLTFYVDDPGTTTISSVSITVPTPARYISGVPSLDVDDDILVDFTVDNAVRKHYNQTMLAILNSSQTTQNNVAPPGTAPTEGSSVSYTDELATIEDSAYSEDIQLSIKGVNSKGDYGTEHIEATSTRVDTVSDEQTLRKLAGSGEFPSSGYGTTYDSEESLKTSYTEELQLLNGLYQRPTGDYTGNSPVAGEDYSTGMGTDDRWVLIDASVTLSNASSFIITLQDTEGTWGSDPETPDISIQAKVEGVTGWLDCNASYPLVGSPLDDGDPAMVYSDSTATQKKVTFGPTPRSGTLYIRIGLPDGSDKKFGQDVLVSDII